ncbi:MAG: hypothetical protein KatS3mg039_0988 [Candidatus Kapaibacterium sp.]|nr:MAG: hypothetical protein KatS3mg039_0988 [Candidatus Kapabacteria bacterium]
MRSFEVQTARSENTPSYTKAMLDFFVDHLLLRRGFYDDRGSPRLATGAVVFGALLRSLLVIIAGFVLWQYAGIEVSIPASLLLLWGYAVYPAYRQLVVYSEQSQQIEEELLCSSCIHFNRSGHYCQLYDEHVRPDYIPCGGSDWEPS